MVDKLLNCCFVVYGLVAAIVASAVMGVFLLIAGNMQLYLMILVRVNTTKKYYEAPEGTES